jgi:hypothetical protein
VPVPDATAVSAPEASELIFAAIDTHRHELDRRNRTIEAICAAEDRHKAEERDAWHRYEKASIALLTTTPATMGGVIALMNYVGLPECSGPGACETILVGAKLSSKREAAAAAERFPVPSAQVLQEIAGERSHRNPSWKGGEETDRLGKASQPIANPFGATSGSGQGPGIGAPRHLRCTPRHRRRGNAKSKFEFVFRDCKLDLPRRGGGARARWPRKATHVSNGSCRPPRAALAPGAAV